MAVTAVASYVNSRGRFSLYKMQDFPPELPEITKKYPDVGANGSRTNIMLTDQALLLHSTAAKRR